MKQLNEPDLKSSASSGWAALSGGASSLWKSAASLYSDTAQEEEETSAFPRTNQDIANRPSSMGQGISSSQVPPAAPVPAPVPTSNDEWPSQAAPRVQSSAKNNKPKKEVDLFAEFGV